MFTRVVASLSPVWPHSLGAPLYPSARAIVVRFPMPGTRRSVPVQGFTSLFLNPSRRPVSPAVGDGWRQLGPCASGAGPRLCPATSQAAHRLRQSSGGREIGDPVAFFSGARWKCRATTCGPSCCPKPSPAAHPPRPARALAEHILGPAAKYQAGGPPRFSTGVRQRMVCSLSSKIRCYSVASLIAAFALLVAWHHWAGTWFPPTTNWGDAILWAVSSSVGLHCTRKTMLLTQSTTLRNVTVFVIVFHSGSALLSLFFVYLLAGGGPHRV